jgi:hypothetical protein
VGDGSQDWPALPLAAWKPTRDTLHMWTQIVGKVRLALSTPLNHWWHVPLYVTSRGLTTSPMPYSDRWLQIDFDLTNHLLTAEVSDGPGAAIPLPGHSVASFYQTLMATLASLGIEVRIWPVPVEVPERIPFDHDDVHAEYDPEHAHRFWRVLLIAQHALERHRARFAGKASPVHFFWGSFDLSVTLYSGRPAPEHPGVAGVARRIMVEAYSREEASFGFWPGDARFPEPAFYAYAYPEPAGFAQAQVGPEGAFFSASLGEYLYPYERARQASDPEQAVAAFLESTYAAAADLARWDRGALEWYVVP